MKKNNDNLYIQKELWKEKLEKLTKRRTQALKEKDRLLALDLELRIERTKAKLEKS